MTEPEAAIPQSLLGWTLIILFKNITRNVFRILKILGVEIFKLNQSSLGTKYNYGIFNLNCVFFFDLHEY